MTSTTTLVKPRAVSFLRPSRNDRNKRMSLGAINTTIETAVEDDMVSPLRPMESNRFDRTKRLSLGVINATTKKAADDILVERIAEAIASYRISGPDDRYEEVMKPKMLETLRSFVSKQEPINMVVPAYPFKSPNHESKVLGPEPDVGERMTLQHFNSIGARIQQIYPPGGHVTIVSDGVCYNDLLGVSDEETFDYAKGLHRITEQLGLKHLKFTDLFELIGGENSPKTTADYASRVGKLKDRIFSEFLPAGYDFDEEIKSNKNALMTYRGYMKFLESDLATFFKEKSMSKSGAKKHGSKVARGMIERGKAFSALVDSNCPMHVRLSIHASDNTRKLSTALLPHERFSNFPVTPWHNTPYMDSTNDSLMLGRKPGDSDVPYKVCKDELGLKFLCAEAPVYSVMSTEESVAPEQQVKVEPLYPFGLKVQASKDTPITQFSLNNITGLAKLHSLLIVEGLEPIQYTSKVASDFFRRMASDGLSLRILNKGIVISTSASKATSYLSQVATIKGATMVNRGQAKGPIQPKVCFPSPLAKSLQEVENMWANQLVS